MTEQPVTLQMAAHDATGCQTVSQTSAQTMPARRSPSSVARAPFEREYAARVRRILEAFDQVLERRVRLAESELGERPDCDLGCARRGRPRTTGACGAPRPRRTQSRRRRARHRGRPRARLAGPRPLVAHGPSASPARRAACSSSRRSPRPAAACTRSQRTLHNARAASALRRQGVSSTAETADASSALVSACTCSSGASSATGFQRAASSSWIDCQPVCWSVRSRCASRASTTGASAQHSISTNAAPRPRAIDRARRRCAFRGKHASTTTIRPRRAPGPRRRIISA
jgi:hypothetical protein